MRIGIYGGSFNPIHIGHKSLAESIVAQGLVDEVWILVSPLNPLKQNVEESMAEYPDRLRMAELATEDNDALRISDFERRLPVPSYTITTLEELGRTFPEHEFSLIIGADNWESFHQWYRHEDIISNYRVLVYRRPDVFMDETSLPCSVKVVNTPLFNVSSTMIRDALRNGKPVTQYLHPRVLAYIMDKGLYGTEMKK